MILDLSTARADLFSRSRALLFTAFIVIAGVFVAADYTVVYRLRATERETHTIVQNMLTSVELVSRMGKDVARERRFTDAHLLAGNADAKSAIEQQIDAVQSDFLAAANAYEPLANLPGEQTAWLQLKSDVQSFKGPVADLLALSRKNENLAARERLHTLQPQFDGISETVDDLIQINREAAERQVALVLALQRSATRFQTILSPIGTAVTIVVGWWAVWLIGQREDQLVEKSEMLEVQNRELDAFAGRVAHDLRNPLGNARLATAQLIREAPAATATLGILRRNVDRMNVLIEELLALSQAGTASNGVCDPAEAAKEVLTEFSERVKPEIGIMRVDLASSTVRCSNGLLRQALWNLVDNAVKYRRPDVALRLELNGRVQQQQYELRLSDNGGGMTQDECEKAFQPFYRALRNQGVPGTGLGLSIVKRVAEASGGSVSVHSDVGRGTTFTISLPVAEDTPSQVLK